MSEEGTSCGAGGFHAQMSFHSGNVAEQWRMFKRQLHFYFDSKFTVGQQTDRKRIGVLMTALGRDGVDIYDTLFTSTEQPSFDQIIAKFDTYCKPKKNTVFERSMYFRLHQKPSQTFDAFLLELKRQAALCEFAEAERDKLLRDILVIGIRDAKLREELLRDPDLSLATATQACKAREQAQSEASLIEASFAPDPLAVADVKRAPPSSLSPSQCPACSYRHGDLRPCPAVKGTCNKCGQVGHFSRVCRAKLPPKPVKAVATAPATETAASEAASVDLLRIYECRLLRAVEENTADPRAWFVDIVLNAVTCRFKLDTAAECNTLSEETYLQMSPRPELRPSPIVIKPYNAPPFHPLGRIVLPFQQNMLEFYVMPAVEENLLGFRSCRELHLLERVSALSSAANRDVFVNSNRDLFQGDGKIPGLHKLYVDPTVSPKIARPRRFAYALLDRVKQTLLDMQKQEIIVRVTEPTSWVSNITIVEKQDGTLRVCLDPLNLNKALQVPKYAIPKPDDILVKLVNKKFFTVLDLKSGFWHMQLDAESSKLTTFNSPLGRFRFTRLCFGINCAPEMFMAEMVKIFGDIENVSPYFDDLIIATETEEQHDATLARVCHRAREFNIKFNVSKLQFKQTSVQYLGLFISEKGMQPALKHIRALTDMPKPGDKTAVLRFLGLVKFLARFIPNVSQLTAHLRKLTHKDSEFLWTTDHDREFQYLKKLIVAEPVLAFFDPNCPVIVQTDSSKDGLGSVLLQRDKPVAFASRALTAAEVKYSQIEKELLAIVFALERFHEFVYGRRVVVQSDHRPLEAIVNKDLDKVTAHLQRLHLRLLKYNAHIQYTPGKSLLVADALSRAFLTDETPCLDYQSVMVHAAVKLAVSPQKVDLIARETAQDAVLATVLKWVSADTWPEDSQCLTPGLARFRSLAPLLTLADGMLFYENRLVVPASLRTFFLEKLHEGHLGCEKTKRLARDTVFWHGMSADVATFVSACTTCQKFARNNVKEKLQPYPIPLYPWQQLAVDIATFQQANFLVVVDKYSNWPEVTRLSSKTAQEVVAHLQNLFAKQGIPEVVVSDNNPFNSTAYLEFAEEWGFTPVFTSPHYPQSNGHAEKTVQTVKMLLKKCTEEKSNFHYALLQYRNTPLADTNCSPAQALMGRRLRTKLPVTSTLLQPQTVPSAEIIAQKEKSQHVQQYYYDQDAETLPSVSPNQPVWVKDKLSDPSWQPATVTGVGPTPRSFIVKKDGEGGVVVRNRRFLRPRNQLVKPVRYRT